VPAISVPCGFCDRGLPIAFQLAGPPFSEALLLKAAAAYQRETGFHQVAPRL
jgi:aspartyl-tRNA(Asn)/glutamyl-tRNA(Gln) amidotransferase subunit A